MTTLADDRLLHTAFYRFVPLAEPDAVAAWLLGLAASLQGSVIVAPEGLNGVLAGPAAAVAAFEQALQAAPPFGALFAGIAFKRSHCTTPPFGRLKVQRKRELVSLGWGAAEPTPAVPSEPAPDNHVSPAEWRRLIAEPGVVVLDNRNGFEYRLGHFQGAVNPEVSHFRSFPDYVRAQAPAWRAAGARVAMYCTGGIRCDRTSDWMAAQGLAVYQLDGGILNYFQALPDAERDWQGECFVFDNRIALDTRLEETGTTPEQVFAGEPDAAWRIARARRLAAAVKRDDEAG